MLEQNAKSNLNQLNFIKLSLRDPFERLGHTKKDLNKLYSDLLQLVDCLILKKF